RGTASRLLVLRLPFARRQSDVHPGVSDCPHVCWPASGTICPQAFAGMSVELRAVRKNSFGGQEDPLFDGLDISAESGAHVGILGAQKTGKSTLLRMIC